MDSDAVRWIINIGLTILVVVWFEQFRLKSRYGMELLDMKIQELQSLSYDDLRARIGLDHHEEEIKYKGEKFWLGWRVASLGRMSTIKRMRGGAPDVVNPQVSAITTDLEIGCYVDYFTILPVIPIRIGRSYKFIISPDGCLYPDFFSHYKAIPEHQSLDFLISNPVIKL